MAKIETETCSKCRIVYHRDEMIPVLDLKTYKAAWFCRNCQTTADKIAPQVCDAIHNPCSLRHMPIKQEGVITHVLMTIEDYKAACANALVVADLFPEIP